MSAVPQFSAEFHNQLIRQQVRQQMQAIQQQAELYYGGHRQAVAQAYGRSTYAPNYDAGFYTFENCTFHTNDADSAEITRSYAPDPLENAGIRAGEIEAWRCWLVRNDDWLASMFVGYIWMPREIIQAPTPPNDYGALGIHAWKEPSKAIEYGIGRLNPVAVGCVHLWGEVVEHEEGYRAEYAKIISIDYILNKKWRARAMRKKLQARYCA